MGKTTKTAKRNTPLMTQYYAVKKKHKDTIVFFRMGDFYEMFNEDAVTASKVLGITLTSRGHGKAGDVPLAGFPHHALEGYLAKMIKAGFRVAICEQVEDPKEAKGIVKREVVQIVTPGTVTSENILELKRNNYLSAICEKNQIWGFATADVSTGEFLVTEFSEDKLMDEIESIRPSEILIPEAQKDALKKKLQANHIQVLLTDQDDWNFNRKFGYEILTRHFGTTSLKGYGCEDLDSGISAAGAVLNYLKETQKNDLTHITALNLYTDDDFMHLDAATRRNLEITASMMSGEKEGSLLSILDQTKTPMGGRTLLSWLNRPLNQLDPICIRNESVEELYLDNQLRDDLTSTLRKINDLERLLTKVVTNRANPKDIKGLSDSLQIIPRIKKSLNNITSQLLKDIKTNMDPCKKLTVTVDQAIVDNPPNQLINGGVIKEGYNAEVDELRNIAFSGKDWIAKLQSKEKKSTNIPSLKIGFNKVFGYYIEVTKTHLSKVPEHYIRKQTLVNAERYITPELKEMEEKILKSEEKLIDLEKELFNKLIKYIVNFSHKIQEDGKRIGQLDSLLSLSQVAFQNRYIKPTIKNNDAIILKESRHPVVEKLLPPGEPFIPNDVNINNNTDQILIITGPNMAGKSTYIRQVGLITLMAQIGSFVPATSAEIGIVDRIFTRVGAQDNLAGGESTFLVEMNETANILNNATQKSLVLLDEIGRGTSTFDGLSIAWAVAEFLHCNEKVRAKTLFATHYHELTELALIFDRVKNYNVAVKEWGDNIVFLRKIVPGGCDHSYGIQVAKLAGLPKKVIERAKRVLNNLENNELTPNQLPKLASGNLPEKKVAEPQLDIFSEQEYKLREALNKIDVNNLTPIDALNKLNDLKKIINDSQSDKNNNQ